MDEKVYAISFNKMNFIFHNQSISYQYHSFTKQLFISNYPIHSINTNTNNHIKKQTQSFLNAISKITSFFIEKVLIAFTNLSFFCWMKICSWTFFEFSIIHFLEETSFFSEKESKNKYFFLKNFLRNVKYLNINFQCILWSWLLDLELKGFLFLKNTFSHTFTCFS